MITIEKLSMENAEDFAALRKLWSKTFGDEEAFVDAFYDNWGEDAWGFLLKEDGKVCSALTQFKMGDLLVPRSCIVSAKHGGATNDLRLPAYISYAICTSEDEKGKGYGSQITEYARDYAESLQGASLLSPAEASLVRFYMPLSYEPKFYARKLELDLRLKADLEPAQDDSSSTSDIGLEEISAKEYGELREQFLSDTVHIELSDKTLSFIEDEYDGFYKLCSGEIIAVLSYGAYDGAETNSGSFVEAVAQGGVSERELCDALAQAAAQLGLRGTAGCITKGNAYLDTGVLGSDFVQAMLARDNDLVFSNGYFGFPFA